MFRAGVLTLAAMFFAADAADETAFKKAADRSLKQLNIQTATYSSRG